MAAVPVHEYWLEHKRAMVLELAAERGRMIAAVDDARRSALLGVDLLEAKLHAALRDLHADAEDLLHEAGEGGAAAWRRVAAREQRVSQAQREVDAQTLDVLQRSKALELERAAGQLELQAKRRELDQWAHEVHARLAEREGQLRHMARDLEANLGVAFAARPARRGVRLPDAPVLPPLTSQGSKDAAGRQRGIGRVTFPSADVPRVPPGQPLELTFAAEPAALLAGMPATLTYLEGRRGSVGGTCVATVERDGAVCFDGVTVHGPPGSSHVVLVSVPRVAAGTVDALELPVHIVATPEVRCVGTWDAAAKALVGRLQVVGVELFGLLGLKAQVQLQYPGCPRPPQATIALTSANEVPFEFPIDAGRAAVPSWGDLASGGGATISAVVPQSKYSKALPLRFEVRTVAPDFSAFQHPVRDTERDIGLAVARRDMPYGELAVSCAVAPGAQYAAMVDVAGRVALYVPEVDGSFAPRGALSFESLCGGVSWGAGGTWLAAHEPRAHAVHLFSTAAIIGASGSPTPDRTLQLPLGRCGAFAVGPPTKGRFPCVVAAVDGAVCLAAEADAEPTTLLEAAGCPVTTVAAFRTARHGPVAVVGYASGLVSVVGLVSRRVVYKAQAPIGLGAVVAAAEVSEAAVVVAAEHGVGTVTFEPTGAVAWAAFRSPSAIAAVAVRPQSLAAHDDVAAALAAAPTEVLLSTAEGHVCVVSMDDGRVLGLAALQAAHDIAADGPVPRGGVAAVSLAASSGSLWRAVALTNLRPSLFSVETEVPPPLPDDDLRRVAAPAAFVQQRPRKAKAGAVSPPPRASLE